MKGSLLIVEESEGCLGVLANVIRLRYPDIDVDTATSALDAFRLLKSRRYDLIVLDLYIGRSERPSLIAEVCSANNAGKSIIAITADRRFTLDSLPDDVRESCVQDVLEKPIVVADLLKSLERAFYQGHHT